MQQEFVQRNMCRFDRFSCSNNSISSTTTTNSTNIDIVLVFQSIGGVI